MSVASIIIIVIIIVILFFLIKYYWSSNSTLTSGVNDASVMQTISASSLKQSDTGANAANYTYSIWVYIDDWSYRYGEEKIIFGRAATNTNETSTIGPKEPGPLVTLGALENSISFLLTVYPGSTSTTSVTNSSSVVNTCSVRNIPIQKWVNVLMSVYGRSLDVYLDGKLVKTCVLDGPAKVNSNTDVYVTPNGGFSGYTSKFQYWPNATDPQTAWNIYSKGYSNRAFSAFNNPYSVSVSVYDGDVEKSSFTF